MVDQGEHPLVSEVELDHQLPGKGGIAAGREGGRGGREGGK